MVTSAEAAINCLVIIPKPECFRAFWGHFPNPRPPPFGKKIPNRQWFGSLFFSPTSAHILAKCNHISPTSQFPCEIRKKSHFPYFSPTTNFLGVGPNRSLCFFRSQPKDLMLKGHEKRRLRQLGEGNDFFLVVSPGTQKMGK